MSALAAGSYVAQVSIEYKDDLRGFGADAFAARMQALMIERFNRSTVLAPNAPVNPAVQTWRSRYISPVLWVARIAFAFVTSGTSRRAIAEVVAAAFREAGAGSDVDVADLASKIDEGDSLPFSFFTGPFGHVSMTITRVAAAPAVVEPSPIDSSVVEPVSRATVRQGERVVVPPPVAPGSSTPAPTQQPPPDTTRPYGGTPDDPLIPDDPPPGRAPSWAPAAAMVAVGLALFVAAVVVDSAVAQPQQPRPEPPRRR